MKPPPGRIPACLCSASLSECHKVQWHRHPRCPSLRAPAVGVAPACVGPHPCVHACVCVRVCVCAGIPVVLSVWSGGSSAQQVQGRPVHETGSQVLGDLDELAGGGPGLVQVRAGGLLGRCGMTRRLPIGSRVRAAAWSSGGAPCWGQGLSLRALTPAGGSQPGLKPPSCAGSSSGNHTEGRAQGGPSSLSFTALPPRVSLAVASCSVALLFSAENIGRFVWRGTERGWLEGIQRGL